MDAIWVSHKALGGYRERHAPGANQLLASQDPVALDCWSARSVLFPWTSNPATRPTTLESTAGSGLHETSQFAGRHRTADEGIHVGRLTKFEGSSRSSRAASPDGGIVATARAALGRARSLLRGVNPCASTRLW